MPGISPRAALVAAMLSLPAGASALTCAEDPGRAERLAREADAIVIGRVTHAPGDAPEAAPPSAEAATTAGLAGFGAPPTVRELEIEATEVMKGEAPSGVFKARFLEGPCAPAPAEGERRILHLVRDGDGWRVLSGN